MCGILTFNKVAKAYQVEHCYIPRLCVSREASKRLWYKEQLFQGNWTEFLRTDYSYVTVSHLRCPRKLPCVPTPRKFCHDKDHLLLITGTLCGRAMSHVSMWWWAKRRWHGRSQKTGSQKNKKTQGVKERILLWNPTQGPVLKETNQGDCLCEGLTRKNNTTVKSDKDGSRGVD